jgi:hypothetical protein
MSRWAKSNVNDRKWEKLTDSLKETKAALALFDYDPTEPHTNGTYHQNIIYNYSYDYFTVNTKTFILPNGFITDNLDVVLTPFSIPALPVLIDPPKADFGSYPELYGSYKNIRFSSYFTDVKWRARAEKILDSYNFERELVSDSEVNIIRHSILLEEAEEIKLQIIQLKNSVDRKYEDEKKKLDNLRADLFSNPTSDNICRLIEIANKKHFLPEFLRKKTELAIDEQSKTLLIQFEFPDYTNVEISTEYKNKKRELKYLTPLQKKKAVRQCLYSLIIRAGYLASKFNIGDKFESVVINVEQNWFDPATGQPRNGIIASVQASTEYLKNLDLSKLDPELCFRSLKGLVTPNLELATPIRPIFVLNRNDSRFVKSKNLDSDLQPEANLAAMEWEDFEHLVAQLFEWEFASKGIEVRVTRASRDRGVDAVLFDPDPFRGGKYVLQAKRYTRTVDVSSVRDLYGTVMNEGANRGILITTASFGPDSYEFAKDKPISLVDGPNLLAMLQKHGKSFRIDLEEARKINGL